MDRSSEWCSLVQWLAVDDVAAGRSRRKVTRRTAPARRAAGPPTCEGSAPCRRSAHPRRCTANRAACPHRAAEDALHLRHERGVTRWWRMFRVVVVHAQYMVMRAAREQCDTITI